MALGAHMRPYSYMYCAPHRDGVLQTPRDLRPIAPYPSPLLGRRVVIVILRPRSRGLDYRSFCFSHAPTLTIGSTVGLLVGCSGGQFAQHWSGS